jgi:DNA modification methylase
VTMPWYINDQVKLWHGDSLALLQADENGYPFDLGYGTGRLIPDRSIDAVVTDPPYGIRFMGQAWDGADIVTLTERWRETNPMPKDVGGPNGGYRSLAAEAGRYQRNLSANQAFQTWVEEWAIECLRVLKPGGHLLASGSSRTGHRLAAGIEDAGFEIRDSIAWLYGSGFPKNLDVSKAIDKHLDADRLVTGRGSKGRRVESSWAREGETGMFRPGADGYEERNSPATPAAAAAAAGWGTALKPAFEPIVVARKPLAGTVAANVLAHGTGALNIDACRIGVPGDKRAAGTKTYTPRGMAGGTPTRRELQEAHHDGLARWPANVILDESQAAVLDLQAPNTGGSGRASGPSLRNATDATDAYGARLGWDGEPAFYGDRGGASRFFYVAKADSSERVRIDGVAHPTVKPLSLMRWLVRLITPPGGTVLEPFAGSGTTVEACLLEGFHCIAIEREPDYLPLIVQRINRRRDPVAAVHASGQDAGLFDLLGGEVS